MKTPFSTNNMIQNARLSWNIILFHISITFKLLNIHQMLPSQHILQFVKLLDMGPNVFHIIHIILLRVRAMVQSYIKFIHQIDCFDLSKQYHMLDFWLASNIHIEVEGLYQACLSINRDKSLDMSHSFFKGVTTWFLNHKDSNKLCACYSTLISTFY